MLIKASLWILSALVLTIAVIASIPYMRPREYKYAAISPQIVYTSKEEEELYSFISSKLISKNHGIYTNTLDIEVKGDFPGGKEILSESIGLIMQYAIEADSSSLFEKYYLYLTEIMIGKKDLIIWKVNDRNKKSSNSNALIDDLRICGLLIDAYEKWGKEEYLKTAVSISRSIREHNIKNSVPVDYYNHKLNKSGDYLTISYIDSASMKKLSVIDENWVNIYETSLEVLKGSRAGKNNVFYNKRYNVVKKVFEMEDKVNMIDLAITLENAIEAGLDMDETLLWIKNNYIRDGFIANEYSFPDGEVVCQNESPAVYALLCRLFYLYGHKDTAEKLFEKLLEMRVTDAKSEFFGGYANTRTGEAFSFDNLQGLITVRYRNNIDYCIGSGGND